MATSGVISLTFVPLSTRRSPAPRRGAKGAVAAPRHAKAIGGQPSRLASSLSSAPPQTLLLRTPPAVVRQSKRAGRRAPPTCANAAVSTEAEANSNTSLLWSDSFELMESQVFETADGYRVELTPKGLPGSTLLHWGVDDWSLPDQAMQPHGTNQVDDKAVQTPIGSCLTINIPKDVAPRNIQFVLKVVEPEEQWHNNGSCFFINVKPPSADDIVEKALDAEVNWSSYTLMQRYVLAMENLGKAEKIDGGDAMGFLFTWLRLSSLKQLDWYRNGNYQPKDMAHVQKTLAEMLLTTARTNKDPLVRQFARMTAAGIPRGGGDAEQIRLEILNIFRRHNIKEGHRPGIEDEFLQQWHQKLHSATTVEDVYICEAYLHFLHTGNADDMWWHLWEYNKISRDDLAAMKAGWKSNGITGTPNHMPHMIPDFQHYLWILKTVHSGTDLDTMAQMSQGHLDGDLVYHLFEVVNNKEAWWVAGKVVEVRERLEGYWREGIGGRDVYLLDIALEKFFRLAVERSNPENLERDDLLNLTELSLRNACIASESEDLGLCLQLIRKVLETDRWSTEGAAAGYAATERALLALTNYTDQLYARMQPHAETFQEACDLDKAFVANFSEEVIRGHPTFVVSQLLQLLLPMQREAAGLSPWQVVSLGGSEVVVGETLVADLADIQGASYDTPQVLVSGEMGGLEDIPAGVTVVLCEGSVDMLSHVAIRARNQGVLLAACSDSAQLVPFKELAGSPVQASVGADGAITLEKCGAAALGQPAPSGDTPLANLKLEVPEEAPSAWAVQDTAFLPKMVGAKGKHLASLRKLLANSDIRVPTSVALPFGTYERCCQAPENKEVTARLDKLHAELAAEEKPQNGEIAVKALSTLEAIRNTVLELNAPPALLEEVMTSMTLAGLEVSSTKEVWCAIRQVWASQFGDRAWLSRKTMGVPDSDLRMACLLQGVVPAQYAFVLHTVNPLKPESNEMLGEVVVGLGETLVSNTPGRALAFTCGKDGSNLNVMSMPSKRTALHAPAAGAVIARSDSNAEDLEEFAGAGLYDSMLVGEEPREELVNYAEELLLWDAGFRGSLLTQLAKVGAEVETALGGVAQDIEGTVGAEGEVYVVQARPQIMSS